MEAVQTCQWLLLVGQALSISVVPEGEWQWLDQQKSHRAFIAMQAARITETAAVPKIRQKKMKE